MPDQNVVVTGRENSGTVITDTVTANSAVSAPTVTATTALMLTNQASAPATPTGGAVLYSSGGVVTTKTSGGTVTALNSAVPGAADSALAGWAFDPVSATQTFLTTAGVLYLSKVVLTSQQTLTNGLIAVTTAGGTLTTGQNLVALFNSTGTQIAISADQTTAFAAAGLITAAWATPVSNATPGAYYVGVLCNGTTAITLASGSTLKPGNVSVGNAGLTTATSRFLTSGTSQTAMPASVTLSSASGNVAASVWAALS